MKATPAIPIGRVRAPWPPKIASSGRNFRKPILFARESERRQCMVRILLSALILGLGLHLAACQSTQSANDTNSWNSSDRASVSEDTGESRGTNSNDMDREDMDRKD